MKTTKIGDLVYVIDNSYIEPSGLFLAATIFSDAKPVYVVSEPYNKNVSTFNGIKKLEFIDVNYDGHIISVLNCLTNIEPKRPRIIGW